jgi:hypothetical protein
MGGMQKDLTFNFEILNARIMRYLFVLMAFSVLWSCNKKNDDDEPAPAPPVDSLVLIRPVDTTLDPYGPLFEWEALVPGPYRLQVYNISDDHTSWTDLDTLISGTTFRWDTALVAGHTYRWKLSTPGNKEKKATFTARNVGADLEGDFPVTIRYHTWGIATPVEFDTTYQGTFNLFIDNGVLWVSESTSNLNQDVYPVARASDSLQMHYEMEQFSSLRFVYGKLYYHQDSIYFWFSRGGLAGGGIYEYWGKR